MVTRSLSLTSHHSSLPPYNDVSAEQPLAFDLTEPQAAYLRKQENAFSSVKSSQLQSSGPSQIEAQPSQIEQTESRCETPSATKFWGRECVVLGVLGASCLFLGVWDRNLATHPLPKNSCPKSLLKTPFETRLLVNIVWSVLWSVFCLWCGIKMCAKPYRSHTRRDGKHRTTRYILLTCGVWMISLLLHVFVWGFLLLSFTLAEC